MYEPYLKWIDDHHSQMITQVMTWSAINSFSTHLNGLDQMANALKQAFLPLNASMTEIALDPYQTIDSKGNLITTPLGKALSFRKRPEAPLQVFLGGHYDTVYPPESPFQSPVMIDSHTMGGPGVADMKGGLAVLLYALQAFEQSPFADDLGWEILLNPDEEIGSPGSSKLLEESAKRNRFGLVFEPSLPDGSLSAHEKDQLISP